MNVRAITGFFIIGCVLIIAGYDVWAFMKADTEGTISHLLMSWAHAYPIMPFAIGVLVGHLFWSIRNDLKKENEILKKRIKELEGEK